MEWPGFSVGPLAPLNINKPAAAAKMKTAIDAIHAIRRGELAIEPVGMDFPFARTSSCALDAAGTGGRETREVSFFALRRSMTIS
jgi:hypothetical protein